MHSTRERGPGRLDDEVKVIAHQAPHLQAPAEAVHGLHQRRQPALAVAVVADDRLALVAPRCHVVQRAGNSSRSCLLMLSDCREKALVSVATS